jgi:membrane protein
MGADAAKAVEGLLTSASKPSKGILASVIGVVVLGIAFLLMISLVVGAAVSALGKWWSPIFGGWEVLAQVVNFLFGLVVSTLAFGLIYKYMPRAKVKWHDVWIGAAVTAVLFSLGRFLIGLYIGKSGVASSFGAAACWSSSSCGSTTRPRSSFSVPSSRGRMRTRTAP